MSFSRAIWRSELMMRAARLRRHLGADQAAPVFSALGRRVVEVDDAARPRG
jgi:hypothetical protein